ncbi:MAG: PEP-CTERM sorting domain-containing protein [Planctomycetota bacterium]
MPSAMLMCGIVGMSSVNAQPFTENFDTDVADWGDANSNFNPLTFVASGGPDGSSYATTSAPLSALVGGAGGSSAILFRAQDEFGDDGSSDGAFQGNYLAGGIGLVSAFVRHDAPEPLTFLYRGSTAANFPAIAINNDVPVQPNEWTKIFFAFDPNNPELALESFPFGPDFFAIAASIGHLQIGINIPDNLANNSTPINFDIDQVSITVPEPSTLAMASLAMLIGLRRRLR